MADTINVGTLRALLTLDSAKFEGGMKGASASLGMLGDKAVRVGAQVDKLVQGFSGDKLIASANNLVAAVTKLGGAEGMLAGSLKLTATEQGRVNATVTEALAKYKALGIDAPKAVRDLEEATRGASTQTEGLGARITGLTAAAAAAVFAFREVTRLAIDWVSASNAQEDATARLNTALRAQGTFTPQLAAQYAELATEFEKTTVFADELVMEMQALLVQVGGVMPQNMKAALTATTDLAAGLRIDLSSATMLVAKALEGNTGALKRYGVNIDEVAFKTKGAEAVFDAIAEKMGGQASAQAASFSGQMARIGNVIDNVKEILGGFIANVLKPMIDAFMALPEPVRTGAVAIGLLGTAATALTVAVVGMSAAVSLALPLLGMSPAIAGASALTGLAAAATAAKVALATFAWPVALTAAGAVGIWEVGKAFKNLWATIRDGGSLWAFFTAKDDDNFIRRWLGLSKSVEEAGVAVGTTGEAVKLMASHTSTANTVLAAGAGITDKHAVATKKLGVSATETAAAKKALAEFTKSLSDKLAILNIVQGQTNELFQESAESGAEYAKRIAFVQDEIRELNNLKVEPLFQEPLREFPVVEDRFRDLKDSIKANLKDIQRSVADNFAAMLTGARGFKDAFLTIWRSIAQSITQVLSDLLNTFISLFLKGMLGAIAGQKGAFAAAFSGLFSGIFGGGTAAAAGAAGTAGTAGAGGAAAGGGIGATITGLATNPFTIAAAAGLAAGLLIWKKGIFRGGEEGTQVNPARDSFFQFFIDRYGLSPFDSLAKAFTEAGVSGDVAQSQIAAIYAATTMKALESAVTAIQKTLAGGATFHTGGIVGEGMGSGERWIKALAGEGVTNTSATAALGRSGIAAINRGDWGGVMGRVSTLAGGMQPAGAMAGGDVTITGGINITVSGTHKNAAQLAREIAPELVTAINRMNVGGTRTKLGRGIG